MAPARWASLLATLSLACSAPRSAATEPGWGYAATLELRGTELQLDALFPPGAELALTLAPPALSFVGSVRTGTRAGEGELESRDGVWALPASDQPRPLHWRFHARDAALAIDDPDIAAWRGLGFVGSLSSFLLGDPGAARDTRMTLSVRSSAGLSFACACARRGEAWTAAAEDLARGPGCAFGPLRVTREKLLAGGALDLTLVEMEPHDSAHTSALLRWTSGAATAVAAYFRRFPVERLLLVMLPNAGRGIGDGHTDGSGGATIRIAVSPLVDADPFRDDWVMTHEMIHLALPSLPRPQHWLEEGSATYLEPIVRARAGRLDDTQVWTAMLDEFPQGLAAPGDRGLDHEPSWGRTYYGGASFCLAADVEIRTRTEGRASLEDALAAVVAAGGNVTRYWPIERVLQLGDGATGTHVLQDLYARARAAPWPVELDSTWQRLGVALRDGQARFDDEAPLAAVRRALVRGRP